MKLFAKLVIFAAAATASSLAHAQPNQTAPETRVPDMARFIDWKADGEQGVFVRAYNGRWYYARMANPCRRLDHTRRLGFRTAPNGDLDRYSAVIAEGWRCQIASVTESAGPPNLQ